MSLQEYDQLDLSYDGALARMLIDNAPKEAAQGSISLSGEHNSDDGRPPYLTPAMQLWYRRVVASVRGPALQQLRSEFSAIDLGKGQRGFLIESERDRIERRKFEEITKERENYFTDEKVKRLSAELEDAKHAYEQMKAANGGDDANEWTTKVYIGLLGLFALPELPLNFESFSKFPIITPAIAAALVVIVAVGIAFSSHIVGTTIKQWGELFGGHVGSRDKMKSVRFLALGLSLFTIAMGIVITGRSLLFQEDIQRKLVVGEPLSYADYMAFGFSIGGNILIWFLGVVLAYVAHSHIPGFGLKQKIVKNLQEQVSAMYERDLQHRKAQHISSAQKALGNLEQLEVRQLRSRPDYVAARSGFEALRKIDNRVLALLEEYRASLVSAGEGRSKLEFIVEDINNLSDDKRLRIDISAYEQMKLRLPYA
ncbi:hypothetical protein [Tardiphaga sp.]|uniref:hypothetical protein n=1 Tax=Tardiphaga sp. TaxID=1926292 RepID=UPI0037D9C6C5